MQNSPEVIVTSTSSVDEDLYEFKEDPYLPESRYSNTHTRELRPSDSIQNDAQPGPSGPASEFAAVESPADENITLLDSAWLQILGEEDLSNPSPDICKELAYNFSQRFTGVDGTDREDSCTSNSTDFDKETLVSRKAQAPTERRQKRRRSSAPPAWSRDQPTAPRASQAPAPPDLSSSKSAQ